MQLESLKAPPSQETQAAPTETAPAEATPAPAATAPDILRPPPGVTTLPTDRKIIEPTFVDRSATTSPAPKDSLPGEGKFDHNIDEANKTGNMVDYFVSNGLKAAELKNLTMDQMNSHLEKAYEFAQKHGLPIKGGYKKITVKNPASQAWRKSVERLEALEGIVDEGLPKPPGK